MKLFAPTLFLSFLVFLSGITDLPAQTSNQSEHEHWASGGCAPIPAGEKRPEFGCFRVAAARRLRFSQPVVYWHLRAFPTRAAAEAAKSAGGAIVEEEGKVWLSEFGPKDLAVPGEPVAVVGPLELLPANEYDAEIAYAILPPGNRTPVHTHFGPEAWYVIAGEQCLETPNGTTKAGKGETMSVVHSIPMELKITGASVRRSLTLVIHDSTKPFGVNTSEWKPTGACGA